ncbi:amphi-Trp domain-containing protein [Halegenticoccus tardaugens]|uniref:amphi-Trp domain-containing protein n=1 Tax=Halegenticoccus tardaugens TaxID=2071624 RepID=UPI00100A3399|nr:amphi-Trp domain-containing protein [Halegenticoccus tardaugens]
MPEETLFSVEQSMDRGEIADYLRAVADAVEENGELTLDAGEQHLDVAIPSRPTFEVKAERETSSGGGPAELSVEFEIEWDEGDEEGGDGGDGTLTIG